MTIKVALAGAGAFGIKHLDGIKNIDGVEVVSLISRDLAKTQEVADKYGIKHVTTDLADSLAIKEVDAVILCTPTQMHASQSIACLEAGKHVQVEIPLCDILADGEKVVALQKQTGLGAMCGRTWPPGRSAFAGQQPSRHRPGCRTAESRPARVCPLPGRQWTGWRASAWVCTK